MTARIMKALSLPVVFSFLAGCTTTRPVVANPTPASIQEYLQRSSRATLLISDSSGHKQWLYGAEIVRDTLRGHRTQTNPPVLAAVPLSQITGVAASRYSTGRTLMFLGGLVSLALVLALNAPSPQY